MKFNDITIPNEIVDNVMLRFFKTKSLLTMSLVSKQWNEIVNSSKVWMHKLIKLGFDKKEISKLLVEYTLSHKQLYQKLTTTSGLLRYFHETDKQDKSCLPITISKDVFSCMTEQLIRSTTDSYNHFMSRYPHTIYGSIAEFFNSRLSNKIMDNEKNRNQNLEFMCSGNTELIKNLMLINPTNCTAFNYFAKLTNDQWLVTQEPTIGTTKTSLIYHHGRFLYVYEFAKKIIQNDDTKSSDEEKPKIYYQITFVIEVCENHCQLLSYQIKCDRKIHEALSKTIEITENNFVGSFKQKTTCLNFSKL